MVLIMKSPAQMPTNLSFYETDYYAWIEKQVALLRARDTEKLDLANLAEEVEDMGKSEKRAVASNLRVVLMHLLKYQFQPEWRTNSWRGTLIEHRKRLERAFEDSPSLYRYALEDLSRSYGDARELAAAETGLPIDIFPQECPYSLEETLNLDFLPE